jgi:hypothetical protein
MQYQNSRKLFQHTLLTAAICLGLTQFAQAADARIELNPQPESSQPQHQAAPAKPAVEPVDEDDGTALA